MNRWPNDAVENLVAADRCNGAQSDHLVASTHLERWLRHRVDAAGDLDRLAAEAGWPSEPARSLALVCTTDLSLPGTQDEKQYRVVKDREAWFHVIMGGRTETSEVETDRIAERVPMPTDLAAGLTIDLAVVPSAARG